MIASVDRRRLARLLGLAALVPAALASGCGRSAPQAQTSTATTGGAGAATTTTTTSPTAAATTRATTTTATTATTARVSTTTARVSTTTARVSTTTARVSTTTARVSTTTAGPPASGRRSAPTTAPAAWKPPSPEPTASQAAYALVDAWADHSRKTALEDASPGAVAALFANPYPAGGPQYRGCSTPPGNVPSGCVFRSGNDLLSLTTVSFPDGWGVTAALMES